MKDWRIMGLLAVLILGFFLISGCTNTGPTSTPAVATSKQQVVYVTATPTLIPGQKTVLFSDDLSSWRSEWEPVYDSTDGKTTYSGGSLHIRDNKPPSGTMYHTLNKNFNDFILDVDTKLVDGTIDNWVGLEIRCQDESNYYTLDISSDGYYEISKWENGNKVKLVKPTNSSYIYTGVGATNHLHVEADKNTLSLSVNGHQLSTVTDNTFNEGTVKLMVNCVKESEFTEVAFNNLVITQI
jgi:hypothetical protein